MTIPTREQIIQGMRADGVARAEMTAELFRRFAGAVDAEIAEIATPKQRSYLADLLAQRIEAGTIDHIHMQRITRAIAQGRISGAIACVA